MSTHETTENTESPGSAKHSKNTESNVESPNQAETKNKASTDSTENEKKAEKKAEEEKEDNFSFLPEKLQKQLASQNITKPTQIQKDAIGPALEGKDILAQSQTGSGKTLAFGLPVGLRLAGPSKEGLPRTLILTPTRELATQVRGVFGQTLSTLGIRCMTVIGGGSYYDQRRMLRRGVDVVVGTPGRIVDLIKQGVLPLEAIDIFVLDEVDQMLDIGFAEELKVVREALPEGVQTLFFSATMNKRMEKMARDFLTHPVTIKVAPEMSSPESIQHGYIPVKPHQELPALLNTLLFHNPEQALIFCATRQECREVAEALSSRGFNSGPLNGDLPQAARMATMERFRKKKLQYLVATNVAARGLDIQSLPLVINFDVPFDVESYTHRTGRTGRAGEKGRAWTLITPRNYRRYWDHMRELGLRPERLAVPSHNEILTSAAVRELSALEEQSRVTVERRIRRVANQLLEEIPPETAKELLRGFLHQSLLNKQAHHTYGVAAEEGDLEAPRHRHHRFGKRRDNNPRNRRRGGGGRSNRSPRSRSRSEGQGGGRKNSGASTSHSQQGKPPKKKKASKSHTGGGH